MSLSLTAPLAEHFSNGQFISKLDELMRGGEIGVPLRQRLRLCRCGCGETFAGNRQYVNQDHYTVWLTAVKYPRWRARWMPSQ